MSRAWRLLAGFLILLALVLPQAPRPCPGAGGGRPCVAATCACAAACSCLAGHAASRDLFQAVKKHPHCFGDETGLQAATERLAEAARGANAPDFGYAEAPPPGLAVAAGHPPGPAQAGRRRPQPGHGALSRPLAPAGRPPWPRA